MNQLIFVFSGISPITFIILGLYVLFWKFVLEKNPIVRDFFDLDRNVKKKKN